MTSFRAGFAVLALALAAYANSLGNGFAYDDNAIIPRNPVVTEGNWREALASPYHPDALEGAGLYRPVTTLVFNREWRVFGENPLGYHLLNVLLHGAVTFLVFLFLLSSTSVFPALAGGALFAVHPLHTEAVANVVGRAELLAALFYLIACLLYLRGGEWRGWRRYFRLVGLGCLYLLSLASKEIGVTLPLALILLEAFRPWLEAGGRERRTSASISEVGASAGLPFWARLRNEDATYLLLGVVLLVYLGLRVMVLGTLTGEVAAPIFQALGPGQRFLTAIGLWGQYLRLLVFPLDLSADYAPGVLFPSEGIDLGVVLGTAIILGLTGAVFRALRGQSPMPLLALGVLWFASVVLPVSNLLFPTGVLLAERTLYLPSVGLSLVVAGLASRASREGEKIKRWAVYASLVLLTGCLFRTVLRNPSWISTYTMVETLNREHPESHLSFLNRGISLERAGELDGAREELDMALRLAPVRYGTLTAVAGFLGRREEWTGAEELLRRAVAQAPSRDDAYRLLCAQLLRQGRGREAHRAALEGLARGGHNSDLWGCVSESYILKGDLLAALRARRAAVGSDDAAAHQWARLGDVLEALGKTEEAQEARRQALQVDAIHDQRSAPPGLRTDGPPGTDGGPSL